MNKTIISFFTLVFLTGAVGSHVMAADDKTPPNRQDALQQSLVYLKISQYPFDQYRPWKQTSVSESEGYGCAVGENLVLTTASACRDAVLVKARRSDQNEFIPATITAIDYEVNLCLLSLAVEVGKPPLCPIAFAEDYVKGASLDFYWLTRTGEVFSGRGYMDRAEVIKSPVSFAETLQFITANITQEAGRGEVYYLGEKAIGIGSRYGKQTKEAWLIPAALINRFLEDARDGNYQGLGAVGFDANPLLDPHLRAYLKMPADLESGVYISRVYTLGTGSSTLRGGDILLGIDDHAIDAHGKYADVRYQRIGYEHLITSAPAGREIAFDLWRDGRRMRETTTVSRFNATDMLVPYYEYGQQPEYIVTGGFIFQTLTRSYMTQIGDQWEDKISPQFYQYFRNQAFQPTPQRRHIVILSYVLPDDANQGYHSLRQLVVKTCNGKPVSCLADILDARQSEPTAAFDVIEFENINPAAVISRDKLESIDQSIAGRYGIPQPVHVRPSAPIGVVTPP
jgi:hypothetical protein